MEQIIAQLSQQRMRLRELERPEDPGRISAMVDVALISLYNRLTNRINIDPQEIRRQASVLASEESGRRQLGPFSPVSLLFLQTPEALLDEKDWVDGIVLPLQRAGWQVNYQMGTVAENVALALGDFRRLGAVIDSRFISGSRALVDELYLGLNQEIQARKERPSLRIFLEDWQERRLGQQDPAYLLEPDLEYSAGSLGELCRIRWAAYLLHGKKTLADMPMLNRAGFEALQKAERFLLLVRNHLQQLRGGQETRLRYEAQEEVALRLGYHDEGDFLAVEVMMRELESHFYNVRLLADRSRELLAEWLAAGDREPQELATRELAPGIVVRGDRLVLDRNRLPEQAGGSLFELFRLAVRLRLPLGLEAYQWTKEQARRLPAAFEDRAAVCDWLFEIIREETPEIRTIRALYDTGVLQALIPELQPIHCLVQHDAFHLYPVHEHHLQTFAEMKRLLGGHYDAAYPEVGEWVDDKVDHEVLLLSALVHDVAKSGGHGHAQRGGERALAIGERLGLEEEETNLLSFLVANHVLLTDSAARRDLADLEMIRHCTEVIGSVPRLRMLMVHSFADLKATGPRAWEYWQNLPMLELYRSLHHHLEKGDPDERTVAVRLQALRGQVAESLSGELSQEELDRHFEQLSPRYLLSVTPEDMAVHLRLERQLEGRPLSWQVRRKQTTWELTLISRQPLGLLSKVAGILTLHRLDIRQAQTHTKGNAVALQIFEVSAPEPEAPISWEVVLTDLEKTLQGKLALEYRLSLHAAQQKRKKKHGPERPDQVVVDNDSSQHYTIIEVYTADRLGLLYAITRTLLDLQLQILLAKISTRMDQVADIFYVRTVDGQRVEDLEQIEEIKRALLFSLK
jgi:[protein-PII] uridylyltransferase